MRSGYVQIMFNKYSFIFKNICHKLCHSTELFAALKIKDTDLLLDYNKCSLFTRLIENAYTLQLMNNIIPSLPKPRKRLLTTTSYFEELFKIISIEYDERKNKYIWNEQIVLQKCLSFMAEADSEFEYLKNMDSVNELRKLFDLPYNAMVHHVNKLMLAVDFDSLEKGGKKKE